MKRLLLLFTFLTLICTACKKLDDVDAEELKAPVDFKLSTASAYLTQVIDLVPSDEKGKAQQWICNFGDGGNDIKGTTITTVSHMYAKAGNFKVSFTTNNQTVIKHIRIFPGLRSYQIKNLTGKTINVNGNVGDVQVDNHYFEKVNAGMITDTVFVMNTLNIPVDLKLSGSHQLAKPWNAINIKPVWFRITSPQLKPYEHTIVEVNASDRVYYYYFLYNLAQRIESDLGKLLEQ